MNQPAQQQHKNAQPEWKPDSKTRILIQSDALFEPRARAHAAKQWGGALVDPETGKKRPLIATTDLTVNSLSERSTIVVLYFDPDAAIKDPETGKFRERVVARRGGKMRREAHEQPDIQATAPINCAQFWQEGTGENDDALDVSALLRAINERITGAAARAYLNDRQAKEGPVKSPTISIRST